MQAIDYGYLLLTPEQHLLSPNSTGHSHRGQCRSHRFHSHSCKSAPAEQHLDENSREFEYGHWLFSSKPQLLSPTISGTSSPCQVCRAAEACRNRPLTPVILTEQSTSGTSSDITHSGGKVEVVSILISNFACPSIVLQPPTAQPVTGLDGPLSSEGDKLSKMLRDGLSDMKESSRSATLSSASQKLKSDTSGSIDWEKKLSIPETPHHIRPIDPSPAANTNSKDSNCSSGSDNVTHCQVMPGTLSKVRRSQRIQDIPKRVDKSRPEVGKSRYWYHLRVRDIISERFRSLKRRIRRSGSSTFSIRSELSPPLHSKVRRLLARASVDIWPSSGEESPVFNTPESDVPNVKRTSGIGSHIDPLAMASMMIATAELDRLSSRMSLDQASRVSASSAGISESSSGSHRPCDKDIATPNNEMPASVPTAPDMPPAVPFNTPSSSVSQSGTMSPVSKPSQRRGKRRRTQRSRLSEVTTPDEIASLAESAEELNDSLSLPASPIETLPECSGVSSLEDENLYPKPLTINRSGQDETNVGIHDTSGYAQEKFPCFEPPEPTAFSIYPKRELGPSSQIPGSTHLDIEDIIVASASSVSEIPQSYEPLEMSKTGEEPLLSDVPLELKLTFLMPTTSSDVTVSVVSRETCDIHSDPMAIIEGGAPAMGVKIDCTIATNHSDRATEPDSCHPDT
ncbi:hypothetical protein F4811DRAFT_559757 [Daldinia bambusicola]|nr:hypothetical protein F4811DRAFT_559757 [Daldinia bambusicola]